MPDTKPLMVPRDIETDIDKLQAEVSDLFRQMRRLRGTPIDVADQLTMLDYAVIDPNRTYLSRNGTKITNLRRRTDNHLIGRFHVTQGGIEYQWLPDGRLCVGMDLSEDIILNAELAPEDPAVIEWRGAARIQKLFEAGTPERGKIRLEQWPEGFVLWYHGSIVWRSWKH